MREPEKRGPRGHIDDSKVTGAVFLIACCSALASIAVVAAGTADAANRNSAAEITGSFADSCRDFSAHSSKDISHVELHHADGRVAKDESTTTPDYAIDGGPGDEIEFAAVKSGTTSEAISCPATNLPPTALLEIRTPDDSACGGFWQSGLQCLQWASRTVWRNSSDFPTEPVNGDAQEAGHLLWLCDLAYECSSTFEFRGTGSSDPEGQIVSWSLDFEDGTMASGSWAADPPAEVAHTYGPDNLDPCFADYCDVTLTVTDAAGQSDSDTITMGDIDVTPD